MKKALEDERFIARGRWLVSADVIDSFGNSAAVARIHEQTTATRERRLVALLKNAPRMLHLLVEFERRYFPLQGCELFDEIDEIVDEIVEAGKPKEE